MATMKEVTDSIVKEIADAYGISKSNAKLALIDALDSNCVIEEIMNQVDFLMENHADKYGNE